MRFSVYGLRRPGWQKNSTIGIELLVERYKQRFRIPENLNHYSKEDLQEAEKKFVKHCIINGCW
jgi:hypothetical protein